MYPGDFDIPMNLRKPAPPLIPPSEIADWSWEKKSEFQFSMCRLHNGTEIYAFASSAPVKAGDPVDEIFIDEEIRFPGHYAEWQARIPDRNGRIFWSSWPAHLNPALLELSRRCQQQEKELSEGDRDRVTAKEFRLRFSDNPFFTKQQVEDTLAGWSETEQVPRDLGEFQTDSIRLYGDFDEDIHRVDYKDKSQDDEISRILRSRNWVPPADWTRYLILDPGTARPAILNMTIPTPDLWEDDREVHVAYREIYKPRMDAYDLAREVKRDEDGFVIQQFIIDGQASRQTPMGFSGTVGENYSDAFAEHGLSSVQFPGSGFIPGDPNKAARSFALRSMMRILPSGRPAFRIVASKCPALIEQLKYTVRHVTKDEEKDEPAPNQRIDVLQCAEYYASRSPVFVPVPDVPTDSGRSIKALLSRIEAMFPAASRDKSSTPSTYFGA